MMMMMTTRHRLAMTALLCLALAGRAFAQAFQHADLAGVSSVAEFQFGDDAPNMTITIAGSWIGTIAIETVDTATSVNWRAAATYITTNGSTVIAHGAHAKFRVRPVSWTQGVAEVSVIAGRGRSPQEVSTITDRTTLTGADTQVLFFNGANTPAGDAAFTFDPATQLLNVGGTTAAIDIHDDGWNHELFYESAGAFYLSSAEQIQLITYDKPIQLITSFGGFNINPSLHRSDWNGGQGGTLVLNGFPAFADSATAFTVSARPSETPTVTVIGTTGATQYGYRLVGLTSSPEGQVHTAGSGESSIVDGNATLDTDNFNRLTWPVSEGILSWEVYRSTGGATQGLIATVNQTTPSLTFTFDDTGLAGDSAVAPTTTTMGNINTTTLTFPTLACPSGQTAPLSINDTGKVIRGSCS